MLKKISLCALLCLSFSTGTASLPAAAAVVSPKKDLSAAEVKRRVERIGVGEAARVKVKMRDGTKMEGFIDRAGEEHFYLVRTDGQRGTAAVIAYTDVAQIDGQRGLFDWRGIGYRAGAGAKVLLKALSVLRIQAPRIAPRFP
jgi:hypothetical protein